MTFLLLVTVITITCRKGMTITFASPHFTCLSAMMFDSDLTTNLPDYRGDSVFKTKNGSILEKRTLRKKFILIPHFTLQEPGGVLVFLPGQDDIEALQSLLEENLPDVVGQQSSDLLGLHGEKKNGNVPEDNAENVVKKGILKDFEIRPLYAAMPPEEQVC